MAVSNQLTAARVNRPTLVEIVDYAARKHPAATAVRDVAFAELRAAAVRAHSLTHFAGCGASAYAGGMNDGSASASAIGGHPAPRDNDAAVANGTPRNAGTEDLAIDDSALTIALMTLIPGLAVSGSSGLAATLAQLRVNALVAAEGA